MTSRVLLLTWTIKPNNDLKHKSTVLSNEHFFDPIYREKDYLWTILFYITRSNFEKFVFCENSWYEIKEWNLIEEVAKKFWKQVELLQYVWNKEDITKYSYHYWEAEILDYAFENSKFLKQTNKFFKVTWRYIIYNINDLVTQYENNKFFFYKWFWLNSTLCVNTAFFMCSKDFYKENLYKKQKEYYAKNYKIGNKFIPLEWVFYNLLKEKLFKENLHISCFPIYHFFTTKKIYIENIKNKLWLLWYWKVWRFIDVFFKLVRKG